MAYWLFKSEPFKWSWDMQKNKGAQGEQWDGVRNYQARNNMRAMKIAKLPTTIRRLMIRVGNVSISALFAICRSPSL